MKKMVLKQILQHLVFFLKGRGGGQPNSFLLVAGVIVRIRLR